MTKKLLTKPDYAVNNIQSLPNIVEDDADNLKATYDKAGKETKEYLEDTLTEELQAVDGANAIGSAGVFGGDNVGDELVGAKSEIQGIVLGQIPDGSLTRAKNDASMKASTGVQVGTVAVGDITLALGTSLEYGQSFEFFVTEDVASATINGVAIKDLEGNALDIAANTVYVGWLVDDAVDFFQLAPRGAGGSSAWLQQYNGANAVLKTDKDKDVTVKKDQYVNNEFYKTKIQGDGSALLPNEDYDTWDENGSNPGFPWAYGVVVGEYMYSRGPNSGDISRYHIENDTWETAIATASGTIAYPVVIGTDIYWTGIGVSYRLVKYDTVGNTLDETLAIPSGAHEWTAAVGTDIYVKDSAAPYDLWKYDTLLDTWDETLTAPSGDHEEFVAIGTDIYSRKRLASYEMWKYDTLTDTWDETLTPASGIWIYTVALGTDIYAIGDDNKTPWKYDTLTDTWDETLTASPETRVYQAFSSDGILLSRGSSPYPVLKYDSREQVDFQIIPPITQVTSEFVRRDYFPPTTEIDKTTPVQVVNATYDTSGNGGRKVVRLTSGRLVAVMLESGAGFKVYVSDNNGDTWTLGAFRNNVGFNKVPSLVTDGVNVTVVNFVPNSIVESYTFDGDVISNTDLSGTQVTIDSGQTAVDGTPTIAVAPNGDLHCAWASKNATYPNSFNIRYSKSTDGGASWDSPTQVTTQNTVNFDYKNPSIVIGGDGYPKILSSLDINNVPKIVCQPFNGSVWGDNDVYFLSTYPQSNPSADVLSDGTIVVAWDGTDAGDVWNAIRYSQSTDNGETWSAMEKLTTSDSDSRVEPSITRDNSDDVYIAYSNFHKGEVSYLKRTSGVWGSEVVINDGTNNSFSYVSTLSNYREFTNPLLVYQDLAASDVKFYGKWTNYASFEDVYEYSHQAKIDGTLEMNDLVTDNVYLGYVSDVNRWLASMEGGNSVIKSYQSGLAQIPAGQTYIDIPIAKINRSISIPYVSFSTFGGGAPDDTLLSIYYLDDETVRVSRDDPAGFASDEFFWEALEYNHVKSLQSGLFALTVTTEQDLGVSKYDQNNSRFVMSYTHTYTSSSSDTPVRHRYKDSETIGLLTARASGSQADIRWYLIEFY